jgi:HAD superfamily hydrolase (TIGR01484 family)
MRYHALATDYDGTIAEHGIVDETCLDALRRLRESKRKLVLVTGRELGDLMRVFPHTDLFDAIVAENGGVLYRPAEREETILAPPPPPALAAALHERGVVPLSIGRAIVATWEPNESIALETIRDLGLELSVIFNKGAVMVLPPGVNKASGLAAALEALGLSRHDVVGIGDAENDHAFLDLCECSIAVANALDSVKEHVDSVTVGARGDGAVELIERLLATDLSELDPKLERHRLRIGVDPSGDVVTVPPYDCTLLLAGPSGAGKSTAATAFLEQLGAAARQYCLIDPEGDYTTMPDAIVLGDADHVPSTSEVLDVLAHPQRSVVVCLLGLALADRPGFLDQLLAPLGALRARTGRPHWLVLDEAHHLLPAPWTPPEGTGPRALGDVLLITVHPDRLSPLALADVDTLVVVGDQPDETLAGFARSVEPDREVPLVPAHEAGRGTVWFVNERPPISIVLDVPRSERLRHERKYAAGTLGPDKSFYFRGPDDKLQLRAQNLNLFVQIAQGVDDATWLHHLEQGDYSRWIADAIKDPELAAEVAGIETTELAPEESRKRVFDAIGRRYTLAA